MRPTLLGRKQFFDRSPKLIMPHREDERIPPQWPVDPIQFVYGIGDRSLLTERLFALRRWPRGSR